jgi:hypothetical protein
MSAWKEVIAVACVAGASSAITVTYARADAATDAEAKKWHDTPAQELSPKMRAFVQKNLKERGESTDLKATMEKIRPFPGAT